jgi:antitoxin MazE
MTATISKWGNSQGLRFPKDVMKALNLSVGDIVEIRTEENRVIIEPVKKRRQKRDIRELVKAIPQEYSPHEVFSDQEGKEAW